MSRFRNPYAPRQYATAEQAAGMTGLHRDTRGNIIGGYAADGTPIGSRSKQPATSATPRLDAGVQTPRLNSNPTVATQRPSRFRSYQGLGDGATKGAASGSPLLRQRQKLFDDMQKAGPDLGGDLAERAKSLGVADSTFRTVAQRIGKRAPAMEPVKSRFMAAAGYPAKPGAQGPASVQPPAMAKATVKPQAAPAANFTPSATVAKPKGGIVSIGAPSPNPPNPLVRAWKQPAAQMPGPPSPSLASAAGYGQRTAKPNASNPSVAAPKPVQTPARPTPQAPVSAPVVNPPAKQLGIIGSMRQDVANIRDAAANVTTKTASGLIDVNTAFMRGGGRMVQGMIPGATGDAIRRADPAGKLATGYNTVSQGAVNLASDIGSKFRKLRLPF